MTPMNNDRGTACRLLRQLREQRGWSWADQARALRAVAEQLGATTSTCTQLGSVQRTIARWESPASATVPGERYQLLLAQLYARNESGDLTLGSGSDFDTLLTALAHYGVPACRTRELRDLVVRSSSVDDGQLLAFLADPTRQLLIKALRDPRFLDVELIDHLAASISEVDRQISSVPFVRLQLLLAPVVEICRRLPDTKQLRARLGALRCDAYLLAGRIAFEIRDDAAARRWYTRAVAASGDPTRRAASRTSYAMTVLHSTGVGAARSIVDAAVADARLGSDLRVRARAYALQAEVAARLGRCHDAVAALRLAWLDLESAGTDGGGFDEGRLRGFEGVCGLHVGTAERAHDQLERCLATLKAPRDQVQYGIIGTDLAIARLRTGDVRSATTLLHGCVDTTAATGGRVAALRIGRARRELAPWRTESFVTELDDHIYDAFLVR
jgi:transcriptional regulator with XRE-family HTH domain